MKALAYFILRYILRWKITFKCSRMMTTSAMIIMAPHTSYWDGIIGKIAIIAIGWKHIFLSAPHLFNEFPMKYIMRSIGAIPIEGSRSIFNAVQLLKADCMKLVICPEGQLAPTDKWNPGFFYMATKAKVPIIVITFNYKTRTITIKDVIQVSEQKQYNAKTIMIPIEEMYSDDDTYAKYPDKFVLPKLEKEEVQDS